MALIELVADLLDLDGLHRRAVPVHLDLPGRKHGFVEGVKKTLPVDRGALFLLRAVRRGVEVGLYNHSAKRPELVVEAKLAELQVKLRDRPLLAVPCLRD